MKKLVIFDLDGTLIDSITDVGICFNLALKENGYPTHDFVTIANAVGGNLEQVIKKLLPKKQYSSSDLEIVINCYRNYYLKSEKSNTRPYPGIYELLEILKKNGALIAINTNKEQLLANTVINNLFKGYKFEMIVGYDEHFPSKPNPFGVNTILKHTYISKDNTVYVGDGISDIETAKAAKVDFLLANWDPRVNRENIDIGTNHIANIPYEVYQYVMGAR